MYLKLLYAVEIVEHRHMRNPEAGVFGIRRHLFLNELGGPLLHQLRHADPCGIALHLGRHIKLKRLCVNIEIEVCKRSRAALEKLWRLSANDAIQRCHSLLPVEDQIYVARRERTVAAGKAGIRFRIPDQQLTDGIPVIQRIHQLSDLIAVPNVPALENRHSVASKIDLAENGVNIHNSPHFYPCSFYYSTWSIYAAIAFD